MATKIHHLLSVTAIVLSSAVGAPAQRVTAHELVAEIQKKVGVEWQKETVDTFKAGNPDNPVTGIAVTMMATMDVLQRASAKGLNFVITHEPTFYAHLDTPEGMPENDPVWAEKRAFIEKHGMVCGAFTIIGTCGSRMESKQAWCIRLDGRNSRTRKISIYLSCRRPR